MNLRVKSILMTIHIFLIELTINKNNEDSNKNDEQNREIECTGNCDNN